jgi:hypothetical protein
MMMKKIQDAPAVVSTIITLAGLLYLSQGQFISSIMIPLILPYGLSTTDQARIDLFKSLDSYRLCQMVPGRGPCIDRELPSSDQIENDSFKIQLVFWR